MNVLSTQPYKGTRDFYPEQKRIQTWMFESMRRVALRHAFQEYDGPLLEPFELYAAKTGEEIVNQQLYWLVDQGERKLAIRPEMTPTLARMVAGQINELPRPIRWFSLPNLWRYERPQRGRLREHWQLNADILGGESLYADIEILLFALDLMKEFKGQDVVQIQVNHRGLIDECFKKTLGLSAEQALGIVKLVDARSKMGEKTYQEALQAKGLSASQQKQLQEFFDLPFEKLTKKYPCPAAEHLAGVFERLKSLDYFGKQVLFNPQIMRGLDYYTGIVFEMYDTTPENNRAMFGGGRYDNLMGLFKKEALSGVGFGMGDVTLQNFLEVHKKLPDFESSIDVFVSFPDENLYPQVLEIAESLRAAGLKVMTPLEVSGFSKQLKQASRHQARFAVLLGESELKEKKVVLKDLKTEKQEPVLISQLSKKILAL